GISWLLERVLPLAEPVHVSIVGNVDHEFQRRAPRLYLRHREWFKGCVDDLQAYYDGAAAVFLPVVAGHGLGIQTLGGVPTGAARTARRLGFRGMAIDLGKIDTLRLADSPSLFARHIDAVSGEVAQSRAANAAPAGAMASRRAGADRKAPLAEAQRASRAQSS